MNISLLKSLSRRASLTALSGFVAAGLAPLTVGGKNSARKKTRKRCKKDTTACLATLRSACAKDDNVESCVAAFTPCCEACSANGFFDCYLNTVQVVE